MVHRRTDTHLPDASLRRGRDALYTAGNITKSDEPPRHFWSAWMRPETKPDDVINAYGGGQPSLIANRRAMAARRTGVLLAP